MLTDLGVNLNFSKILNSFTKEFTSIKHFYTSSWLSWEKYSSFFTAAKEVVGNHKNFDILKI